MLQAICNIRTGKQMDLTRLKSQLGKAGDIASFQPTEAQREAKARFWSYFASGDVLPPSDVSLAIASKYGSDKRISEWWNLQGFPEWFANKDEFRQRVEFLANLALDELYQMIRNPGTQATAKVAAIRMIMDVGKKISQKAPTEETAVSEKIASMGKDELEAYIRSMQTKLKLDEESDSDSVPN